MNALAHWVSQTINAQLLKAAPQPAPLKPKMPDASRKLNVYGPRIVELRENGFTFPQIGKEMGLSHSTVCVYFHQYKALWAGQAS